MPGKNAFLNVFRFSVPLFYPFLSSLIGPSLLHPVPPHTYSLLDFFAFGGAIWNSIYHSATHRSCSLSSTHTRVKYDLLPKKVAWQYWTLTLFEEMNCMLLCVVQVLCVNYIKCLRTILECCCCVFCLDISFSTDLSLSFHHALCLSPSHTQTPAQTRTQPSCRQFFGYPLQIHSVWVCGRVLDTRVCSM